MGSVIINVMLSKKCDIATLSDCKCHAKLAWSDDATSWIRAPLRMWCGLAFTTLHTNIYLAYINWSLRLLKIFLIIPQFIFPTKTLHYIVVAELVIWSKGLFFSCHYLNGKQSRPRLVFYRDNVRNLSMS